MAVLTNETTAFKAERPDSRYLDEPLGLADMYRNLDVLGDVKMNCCNKTIGHVKPVRFRSGQVPISMKRAAICQGASVAGVYDRG